MLEGFYFQRTLDQDFLRDLGVCMEAGLEQNSSAYFVVDLFVASTMTFCSALSTDFGNPRPRCVEELGAWKKVLVRLSPNFDKRVRNTARCLLGLVLGETREQICHKRPTLWHESISNISKVMIREKSSLLAATLARLALMIQSKRSFAFFC